MKKIRINELARELEVKAHEILDRLPELGVSEKKTHSSSIDEDVAIKLRRLYGFDSPDLEREDEQAEAAPADSEAAVETKAPSPAARAESPAEAAPAAREEKPAAEEPAARPGGSPGAGAGMAP